MASRKKDFIMCDFPDCKEKSTYVCDCRRCAREPEPDQKYHRCALVDHQNYVEAAHQRVRGR